MPCVTSSLSSPLRARHLHSFPTRRSSDLTRRRLGDRNNRGGSEARPAASPCFLDQQIASDRYRVAHREHRQGKPRSEEHTSELQSLTNLVCRLLLEKKKTNEATSTLQSHS